jgi:hypothetical protein
MVAIHDMTKDPTTTAGTNPALAYILANFMRTLALPKEVEHWSLTTPREKLVKIGAKVVRHGRPRKWFRSLDGGTMIRFPRIWRLSGERRFKEMGTIDVIAGPFDPMMPSDQVKEARETRNG